ncbi:uncharacterized protein [Spinacia oleracea]|uniref:Endonuclease/exonuclease/phosphatase domain-containing protein n=1 Tax=Spinacia oleracea TaxID=3562 RepID=A0A9R0K8Q5_SPIOL|nr:uncharacterized protein LOC110800548 [Spinacia oleracea]
MRGLNDPSKVGEVKNFLNKNKVSFVALLETRVKQHNSSRILKKFGANWSWVDNYVCSPRGRIWIGWLHNDISLQVIDRVEYGIHCLVNSKNGKLIAHITVVYGLHTVEDRVPMWRYLEGLANAMTGPWCVIGDFNAVLNSADRSNGNPVTIRETKDFEQLLDTTDLVEVKSSGCFYSWSNKGEGERRIESRIDWCLGNSGWHSFYTDAWVEYMVPGLSDHSPLILRSEVDTRQGSRPFKFFNYMDDHTDFVKAVNEGWDCSIQGCAMYRLWTKLKHVKAGLKKLHAKDFAKLDSRIEQLRQDLDDTQLALVDNSTDINLQRKRRICWGL